MPTDDLVPISAWLGQASEPMDRRIAEEALLAGAGCDPDSLGALDARGGLDASSGTMLAPGAAEGLASAPPPLQQEQSGLFIGDVESAPNNGAQSSSSSPVQGGEIPGAGSAGSLRDNSSNQDGNPMRSDSALQQARDGERRQEAYRPDETGRIAEEGADGPSSGAAQMTESTGPVSAQEAYREGGPAENGTHPRCKPRPNIIYSLGPDQFSVLSNG